MSAKVRNKLTLKDKYDIICKISGGETRNQVMRDYHIKHRSHLTSLMKNKQKIVDKYDMIGEKMAKQMTRLRESNYSEVEKV